MATLNDALKEDIKILKKIQKFVDDKKRRGERVITVDYEDSGTQCEGPKNSIQNEVLQKVLL